MSETPPVQPEKPQKNRRGNFRHLPKRKIKVGCRNAMDLGPNLAVTLIDLSESGVRLHVSQEVEKGKEVTISLDSVLNARTVKRNGTVVWCVPLEGNKFSLGVQFAKRLPYSEVATLAGV
jgi:hypothetical protein